MLQLNSASLQVPAERFSGQELGSGVSTKISKELKISQGSDFRCLRAARWLLASEGCLWLLRSSCMASGDRLLITDSPHWRVAPLSFY